MNLPTLSNYLFICYTIDSLVLQYDWLSGTLFVLLFVFYHGLSMFARSVCAFNYYILFVCYASRWRQVTVFFFLELWSDSLYPFIQKH